MLSFFILLYNTTDAFSLASFVLDHRQKYLLRLVLRQILQLLGVDGTSTDICVVAKYVWSTNECQATVSNHSPRIISTASSYFMPASMSAMATRTGALPRPATQWTARQGPLFSSSFFTAPLATLVGELLPLLVPGDPGCCLKRSIIRFSQSAMMDCGGGVPAIKTSKHVLKNVFSKHCKTSNHRQMPNHGTECPLVPVALHCMLTRKRGPRR